MLFEKIGDHYYRLRFFDGEDTVIRQGRRCVLHPAVRRAFRGSDEMTYNEARTYVEVYARFGYNKASNDFEILMTAAKITGLQAFRTASPMT